ncbi:MAG TPA: hypothetical protein VGM88_29950 [Kofleriaceae bacterium]|jgi:Flp pilus assembly protein TadD
MKRALLVAALAACAHQTPPPATPSAAVRADVAAAETAERARQHDVARTQYAKAIADAHDAPSTAYARHEFAETLASWGELAAAAEQLQGAVTAAPGDAAAWHDLGILRHELGDDPAALAALAESKRLAPHDLRPRIALAALHWSRHELPEATQEYRALLQLDLPDRLRAKVQWALGELAKGDSPRNTPR